MAKYDVFLVAAKQDREKAELLAKRLRALKFKVFLDKDDKDIFDAKDARDAENSNTIITLWSKNAVKSDWVRAGASVGRSRKNLIQLALDDTQPYDPFSIDDNSDISDLTAKNVPDNFVELIKGVSKRSGRKGLTQFVKLDPKNKAKKEKWFDKYPEDPMSVADFRRRGLLPTLAEERAAAKAAAASANTPETMAQSSFAPQSASLAEQDTSPMADDDTPPTAEEVQAYYAQIEEENAGAIWWMIPVISACIVALLAASYFVQKRPVPIENAELASYQLHILTLL